MIRSALVFIGCMFWLGLTLGTAMPDVSRMVASFYNCDQPGECSKSKRTASGARFNKHAMTAAHRTFAFGTRLRVCLNGCVVVTINDRGPFIAGRQLDLSEGAARAIGLLTRGVAIVRVERL